MEVTVINENALREVLVNLAETNRNLYVLLVDLGCEVAAMKETIRALDPTFSETFDRRIKEAAQAVAQRKDSSLARFDGLIQKMKDGLVS
jgi:hypothetical protein